MSVVINTNVDSIRVQKSLSSATSKLSQTMQRMSSGLKVKEAKDDAAGCVIAARMHVQMDGNKIAQNNVQSANALLSTAEGHLDVIQDNLSRIRDLTLQARNGTYSEAEKQAMNDEVQQRIAEINRISESSMYSSLQLFGDKNNTGELQNLAKDGAEFQVGANAEDEDRIEANKDLFQSVRFIDLIKEETGFENGLTEADFTLFKSAAQSNVTPHNPADVEADNIDSFNISKLTAGCLDKAIKALDKGLDNLTHRKSIIGSAQNRLASALDTLTTQYENLSSARSLIVDSDVASEASNYTQQSILQQVSTSLLAQANQAPAIALSLI